MALRPFRAYLDDLATIRVEMKKEYDAGNLHFSLLADGEAIDVFIHQRTETETHVCYSLTCLYPLHLEKDYVLMDQDHNQAELYYGAIVRSKTFDQLFTYTGTDLGACYTKTETRFKFWAPISKVVFLVLEGAPHALKKEKHGVWSLDLQGDLEGQAYHYLHLVNGKWLAVHDPYALSSQINSGDSIIINTDKLHKPKPTYVNPPLSQAIIYELSVRDFSQQAEANFQHPSQFLGLTETPSLQDYPLGKEYIKNLGVTHIQLMPVYDFGSVDEKAPHAVYNWGYDPVQYNVPEGSYATNPHDPYARILELQEAIQTYHDEQIGVLMDVVYNHVYHAETYAFEKIVPGYFYRYDHKGQRTNGTFCGNDVASERSMVRHYIKHSLKQWVGLYGFDGFRFDLMGILDIATMQEISRELREMYPHIYLYGEGWEMSTGLSNKELAHQYNAGQLPNIGFFNDEYRNSFKEILTYPQKLSDFHFREKVQDLIAASRNRHFLAPHQSLNYLECHDNATTFDYLQLQDPELTPHEQKRAASFGLQLLLISQGVAFIHSGQEFFRTKEGLDNTYNIPDRINHLDWTRAVKYREHVAFIHDLIAFRKSHPLLSQSDYLGIEETCDFYWLTDSVLRYRISNSEETITLLLNFSKEEFHLVRPKEQELVFIYPQPVDKANPNLTLAGQSICLFLSTGVDKY